jgi:hypothetical protein
VNARVIASAVGFAALALAVVAIVALLRWGALGPQSPALGIGAGSAVPADEAQADSQATPPVVAIGQYAQARDCANHSVTWDGLPPTIETMQQVSKTGMIGTVVKVDEPRWNTANGEAPKEPTDGLLPVYRNVTIKVTTTLKGEPGDTYDVRVPGGVVGCEQFRVEGLPLELKRGEDIALFAQDLPAKDAKGAELPVATNIWAVVEGVVQTPENGDISTKELEAEARAASE